MPTTRKRPRSRAWPALMPADETQLLYSMCLHGRGELGLAPDEYAALTMVLLRLLAFKPARLRPPAEKKTLNEARRPAARPQRRAGRRCRGRARRRPTPPPLRRRAGSRARSRARASRRRSARRRAAGPRLPVVEPPRRRPRGRGAARRDAGQRRRGRAGARAARAACAKPRRARAAARSSPTEDGDFWHATVHAAGRSRGHHRAGARARAAVAAGGRDVGHWMLRVERESLNQPASRERLQAALQAAGHAVKLAVEIGAVTDSPARRNAQAADERQRAAEEIILQRSRSCSR